jgi:DNA-binding transcriptional regulator YiaG
MSTEQHTETIQNIFSDLESLFPSGKKSQIGKHIQEIRIALGLSIDDFAKKLNVNQVTAKRWEDGTNLPRRAALNTIRNLIGGLPNDFSSEKGMRVSLEIGASDPEAVIDLLADLKRFLAEHAAHPKIQRVSIR